MALVIAAVLFGLFVADVVLGALSDAAFLSDVQGLIVLFAASIAFVVAILRREKLSKEQN